jgi:hypothetical protein
MIVLFVVRVHWSWNWSNYDSKSNSTINSIKCNRPLVLDYLLFYQ